MKHTKSFIYSFFIFLSFTYSILDARAAEHGTSFFTTSSSTPPCFYDDTQKICFTAYAVKTARSAGAGSVLEHYKITGSATIADSWCSVLDSTTFAAIFTNIFSITNDNPDANIDKTQITLFNCLPVRMRTF